MFNEYIFPFLLGGMFIVLNKYISNNISPKLGAIVVTFPIGLLSAYYLIQDTKLPIYLKHYVYQALLNVLIGATIFMLLEKTNLSKKNIFITGLTSWALFSSLIYYN